MAQEARSTTQWGQVATLLTLIAANFVTLIIVDRQEKAKSILIREKDAAIAARDREVEALRRACCVPCSQTPPALNCVPSLCTRTPHGLCCVGGRW